MTDRLVPFVASYVPVMVCVALADANDFTVGAPMTVTVPVPLALSPRLSELVTVIVDAPVGRAAPVRLSDQLPVDGDVNCELVPSVYVTPFTATVKFGEFTES